MEIILNIPLVSMGYSIAAIGSGIIVVFLAVLAEFSFPEKKI